MELPFRSIFRFNFPLLPQTISSPAKFIGLQNHLSPQLFSAPSPQMKFLSGMEFDVLIQLVFNVFLHTTSFIHLLHHFLVKKRVFNPGALSGLQRASYQMRTLLSREFSTQKLSAKFFSWLHIFLSHYR